MRLSYQIRHEKFIHLENEPFMEAAVFHILCVGGGYTLLSVIYLLCVCLCLSVCILLVPWVDLLICGL